LKRYSNDDLAALFKRLFATQDGSDVLAVLETRFSKPAMTPPAAVDGMALALMTQQRIGEDNVVRYINALINREFKDDGTDTD